MSAVRPAALVVGLDCVTGLQTARILDSRGTPVIGVATDPGHFACRTRSVERVVAADTASPDVVDAVETIAASLPEPPVLVPCTDQAVLRIAEARERLDRCAHVVQPTPEVVRTLMDKLSFAELAEEQGLPVPRTRVVRDADDARAAAASLTFPCVVKPAVKSDDWEDRAGGKVVRVATADEWLELYERASAWVDALLIQEWVAGDDSNLYSCNGYFRHGEPVASFVARKLRQWPPRQGTSCLGEEVRDDEVRSISEELFRAAGFHGLGYVEVKRDERTGEAYIIEPNVGRPTGRSAIAEGGGVELLDAMYRDTVGLPLPDQLEQTYTGVKWIYLTRDLRSALYYWRAGELTLSDWVRSLRGRKVFAVWSVSDPLPFVAELAQGVRRGLAALASKVRSLRRG